MKNKLKLGVIGVGHMGQYHVKVATSIPAYEIVGIHDQNKSRAQKIAEHFDIPLIEDIKEIFRISDALVISVPTKKHYQVAKMALQNDCHILVEKPITETISQAEELVELSYQRDKVLQVGHVERFNGAVKELTKVVDNPVLVEARRLSPYNTRVRDIGVVLDLMIHDIDIVLNLVKDEIIEIEARGVSTLSIDTGFEDIAIATLVFQSGCLAMIIANRASQTKIRHLNITQPNGYISLDFSKQDIDIYRKSTIDYRIAREELKYQQEFLVEKIEVHRDNPLKQEHEHFIACVQGDEKPLVTGEDDIRTLRIAKEIIESIDHMKRKII